MNFLSTLCLADALTATPAMAMAPQAGEWPDGHKVVWQCQKGAAGTVKFVFITPDGNQYFGALSCGTPV